MKLKPLKVSEVNSYIARILSNDVLLYNINIEGEVSNCKYHPNGHVYFGLKDSKSRIRAIMFKEYADQNEFIIEDGMNIEVNGHINVYERDGSYQVYVKTARNIGKGRLYEEFEKLKEKLSIEGLFDEARKRSLPKNPVSIGIVTSTSGAAVRDMITNIRRRNRLVDILISETLVQGQGSADSIVKSIHLLQEKNVDLMIIGRGGGSIEDLASFNDESVARAIFKSKVPVISAVGHETDFTISDFVADKRASTPSTAAEIAVPVYEDMVARLKNGINSIVKTMQTNIKLDFMCIENYKKQLIANSPNIKLENGYRKLDSEYERLVQSMDNIFKAKSSELDSVAGRLNALSPLKTLERGYSIVEKDLKAIDSVSLLEPGDDINIVFSDGGARAKIKSLDEK